MACAIEDAGFEIRDQIMWIYSQGFPKSMDVSKAIDKAAGAEREVVGVAAGMGKQNPEWNGTAQGRAENSFKPEYSLTAPSTDAAKQWSGWGTALKPAHEPICVARKPLIGTVAANVQQHGTGALNIDGCRVELNGDYKCKANGRPSQTGLDDNYAPANANRPDTVGRWPANVIHDGSEEVVSLFPQTSSGTGAVKRVSAAENEGNRGSALGAESRPAGTEMICYGDSGSAARFFYCAKTSKSERGLGNIHPTVKPLVLMRYLCRIVTPPGGVVLDPFTGSGTTGIAAMREGFGFIGIELKPEYASIANARLLAEVLS
jgi:site-specific DNA-methyltransferase (adenine-specific)